MSTFSSLGSKGGKPKFQSLDINRIYKSSRGESSEKTQQKSTIQYKHGMQILGKVPNARRPPANLPSLKSEHSGSEAAVPLVPPGGPGWGKQDSNSSPNGLPVSKQDHIPAPTSQQAGAPPSQIVSLKQEVPHVPSAPIDKSWSSVMSRGDAHSHHPPPYQGPQFQHDFPSLSSTDGGQGRGAEAPYSSGLSLRPQTEGSWIGGGSGPGGEGKPPSAHLGSPPQLSAQAGLLQQQQQQTLPPQYRGVMPSFMYKNNPPAANAPPSLMANNVAAVTHENTLRQDNQHFNTKKNTDETGAPSIIKEEELHRMDEIERDMGWAYSDDIDYNKKLNFSDDEILTDKSSRPKQILDNVRIHEKQCDVPKKEINDAWQTSNKGHSSEEEEIKLKRTQHFKEVELAVQRAKQRKKEEEKRFNEATKQGAQQKLKELEEKISKRDRDGDESVGTINPSIVPPKPIAPTEIPLPDFQREKDPTPNHKEKEERHKIQNVESHEDKVDKSSNTFKHLTEIEGKTFKRNSKNQDSREQGAPTFSRQFQSDLPPRFKRQHTQQNVQPQYAEHYENRSQLSPNYPKSGISRKTPVENEPRKVNVDEPATISQEFVYKSESPLSAESHDLEVPKHNKKEARIPEEKCEKIEAPDTKEYEKRDYLPGRNRNEVAEIKPPKINKNQDNLYSDRFQRFDSQEPKISREKYTSDDNREYNSWTESRFDIAFEEKRRESHREDRRQVPGPITRDRIEADDFNESRNLTALKRGQIPEKKPNGIKNKEEKSNDSSEIKPSESSESKITDQMDKLKGVVKKDEKEIKLVDVSKKNMKNDDYRDDKRNSNRNKMYPLNKVWNNEYHHRSTGDRGNWPKRSNSNNKNPRSNLGHKMDSFSNIATDSEGSSEDHHAKDDHSHKKSEKSIGKNHSSKDEKRNPRSDRDRQGDRMQDMKRDNYVPRGEPSRLGRGGGNFRGRVGLSKRIDGYGPPPSKSPFTHHDDKRPGEMDGEAQQQIINTFSENEKDFPVDVKGEENNGTTLEDKLTEDKDSRHKFNKNVTGSKMNNSGANAVLRKPSQQSRSVNSEKKHYVKNEPSNMVPAKQGKPDESNLLCSAIADISLKNKDDLVGEVEEESVTHGDSDGFQEVKSKKTVKERPRTEDKANPVYPGKNLKVEVKERDKTKKPNTPQIQPPIHNIPPLMAVTVNPPHVLPQPNKNQFDRQIRQNKIPPRFVKLRENNRLQKMQQQHGMPDMNDIKSRNMFGPKMSNPTGNSTVVPISNAWDKPLGTQLRPMESENLLAGSMDGGNNIEHPSAPGNTEVDKKINKSNLPDAVVILDGATPPVNTIIFENTNFKSIPTNRNVRNDKLRKEDSSLETQSITNFSKRMNDLLTKNDKQSDAIQLQLPFKEDSGDMKLDFFDSALSLPDEKALKNPCLTRPMHSMTSGGNDISTADALNYKIQSVKKVWETPSEHGVPPEDANSNFTTSFVPDTNSLDSSSYVKGNDNVDDNHEQHGYSPAAQQTSNNTTNVCKVKPTQQVSGATNQAVSSTNAAHPAHSGIMGPGLMGNPLSPPPIQPVIGAGVGIGQPPQQFPTNQHIGYQTGLGNRSQYGMSTIPSPPSVLPYTAPPLQAQTANLYGPFQIDQSGVLGGQGRSQYSQYPNHYGLGQAASSPYSAQSMFLQTPQAHPPPAAQGPEMYQNLNSYRLSTAAFGQNQQLNNPTTVLISSTSNSLMSASVKPSTQQISAIGTKSGGVGQAYQQQSQQGQQMFMFDPNIQANYLQGLQRPTGPVQNNVVPTIQPSSSYYSGSTPAAKPFNCSWGY